LQLNQERIDFDLRQVDLVLVKGIGLGICQLKILSEEELCGFSSQAWTGFGTE